MKRLVFKNLIPLLFLVFVALTNCKEKITVITEVITNYDSIRQAQYEAIKAYFEGEGFTSDQIDRTTLGVYYVILDAIDLAETPISDGDSIGISYIGFLLDGTVFATNVDSIALKEELVVGDPLKILYTESGENFEGKFITGFDSGIKETFKKVGISGQVLWVLPSELGYGDQSISDTKENGERIIIPPFSVTIWNVSPLSIEP